MLTSYFLLLESIPKIASEGSRRHESTFPYKTRVYYFYFYLLPPDSMGDRFRHVTWKYSSILALIDLSRHRTEDSDTFGPNPDRSAFYRCVGARASAKKQIKLSERALQKSAFRNLQKKYFKLSNIYIHWRKKIGQNHEFSSRTWDFGSSPARLKQESITTHKHLSKGPFGQPNSIDHIPYTI
jgi:hypothetical protein